MACLRLAILDLYGLVISVVGLCVTSIAVGGKGIFHRIATVIFIVSGCPTSLFMQKHIISAGCHIRHRKRLFSVVQIDVFPLIDTRAVAIHWEETDITDGQRVLRVHIKSHSAVIGNHDTIPVVCVG